MPQGLPPCREEQPAFTATQGKRPGWRHSDAWNGIAGLSGRVDRGMHASGRAPRTPPTPTLASGKVCRATKRERKERNMIMKKSRPSVLRAASSVSLCAACSQKSPASTAMVMNWMISCRQGRRRGG